MSMLVILVEPGPGAPSAAGWREPAICLDRLAPGDDLPGALDAALMRNPGEHVVVVARRCTVLVQPEYISSALDFSDVVGSVGVTEPVAGDFRLAGTNAVYGSLVEDEGNIVTLNAWNPVRDARLPWYAVTGPVFAFRRAAWEAVPFSSLPRDTELALFLQWSRTVRELGLALHVTPRPLGITVRVAEQRLDSLRRLVHRRTRASRLAESTCPRKAMPATAGFSRDRIDLLERLIAEPEPR